MNLNKISFFPLIWFFLWAPSYANECKITEFEKFAAELDKTKIQSVELLTIKYDELSINQSQDCISKLFSKYRFYYYQSMQSYEKSIEKTLYNYAIQENIIDNIESEIKKVGWELLTTEGMYYIGEDGIWFIKRFGSSLPDDWNIFLQQRKKEIENKFSEDAALLISWEEVRNRIIFWENFIKKYPAFQEHATVGYYLSIYLRTYLTGMDNTRVLEPPSTKIDKQIIDSYINFIKFNTNSQYHHLVEGQYNIFKKYSFISSENLFNEIDIFYKKNKLKTMLAVQPPTY